MIEKSDNILVCSKCKRQILNSIDRYVDREALQKGLLAYLCETCAYRSIITPEVK